jgi:hypothetical protein
MKKNQILVQIESKIASEKNDYIYYFCYVLIMKKKSKFGWN